MCKFTDFYWQTYLKLKGTNTGAHPVQVVRVLGSPSVNSGSRIVVTGFCSGCQTHLFTPLVVSVTIAVLSVSAPVAAVVGIQISVGKFARAPRHGTGLS